LIDSDFAGLREVVPCWQTERTLDSLELFLVTPPCPTSGFVGCLEAGAVKVRASLVLPFAEGGSCWGGHSCAPLPEGPVGALRRPRAWSDALMGSPLLHVAFRAFKFLSRAGWPNFNYSKQRHFGEVDYLLDLEFPKRGSSNWRTPGTQLSAEVVPVQSFGA